MKWYLHSSYSMLMLCGAALSSGSRFISTPFSWEQCCGRQEDRAREREAAMETAEKRAELETLLASNLHRRRDELRQALAEADVGAARWAVSHMLSAQGRHLWFLRQHTTLACAPMGSRTCCLALVLLLDKLFQAGALSGVPGRCTGRRPWVGRHPLWH